MTLLKTIHPKRDDGKLVDFYSFWDEEIGDVPDPIVLMSASPKLLKIQMEMINYFMEHKKLEFPLLSLVRYLAAKKNNYHFCTQYNGNFLKMQGMTEEQIEMIDQNPDIAPIDDKDKAMLTFINQALENPESIQQEHVKELKKFGWAEQDIFDAVYHAVMLIIGPSYFMKIFKMDGK